MGISPIGWDHTLATGLLGLYAWYFEQTIVMNPYRTLIHKPCITKQSKIPIKSMSECIHYTGSKPQCKHIILKHNVCDLKLLEYSISTKVPRLYHQREYH